MEDFVRVPEQDWQDICDATRAKTGGTEKMVSGAVADAIAGIVAGGGVNGFEVTEGTITPTIETQEMRIPWDKETLPIFYVVMRQDLDTYVTPDNPANSPVLGGFVNFISGYIRVSSTSTVKHLVCKVTATTGYTGYVVASSNFHTDILTSDGLLAYCNSSAYKWEPDVTYKYYIVDKAVT